MKSLAALFKKITNPKRDQKCLQAAFDGDFKTALDLVDQGADVNFTGTAMLSYTDPGFAKAVVDLVKSGHGDMPVSSSLPIPASLGHIAANKGNPKALEAFLDKGLDPNISLDGKPLLMHALETNNRDVALILLAHGAATAYVAADLSTPLTIAKAKRYDDVAEQIEHAQKPLAAEVVPEKATTATVTAMKPLILKKNGVSV